MKKRYRFLCALHILVGVGAVCGGLAAITDPYSPMGMPTETLKHSPFDNFLIPGLILFAVIGLGNLFSAGMFFTRTKYQGYFSSIFSWALVVWIVVQVIMLRAVAFLHVLFFLIGLVQAILSAALLFEKRLFPANVVLKILKK